MPCGRGALCNPGRRTPQLQQPRHQANACQQQRRSRCHALEPSCRHLPNRLQCGTLQRPMGHGPAQRHAVPLLGGPAACSGRSGEHSVIWVTPYCNAQALRLGSMQQGRTAPSTALSRTCPTSPEARPGRSRRRTRLGSASRPGCHGGPQTRGSGRAMPAGQPGSWMSVPPASCPRPSCPGAPTGSGGVERPSRLFARLQGHYTKFHRQTGDNQTRAGRQPGQRAGGRASGSALTHHAHSVHHRDFVPGVVKQVGPHRLQRCKKNRLQ